MRCGHIGARNTSLVMRIINWSVWVDVNQCVACQEWLPLGPAASVDTEELQLAELLADIAQLWEPGEERTRREDDVVSIMAGSVPVPNRKRGRVMGSNDHEVNLHSDACNDVGHDPSCDYCNPYTPPMPVRWQGHNLATNLRVTAGLERSYRLGYSASSVESTERCWPCVTSKPMWKPGCGKAAP